VFRHAIEEVDQIARPLLPQPLLAVLYPDPVDEPMYAEVIHEPLYTWPCLLAIEYALARKWIARGCTPWAVLGHSLGEFVAAHFAGVLDLRTCTHLMCERGRLMSEQLSRGCLVSSRASAAEVAAAIEAADGAAGLVAIGCCNAPHSTVLSGEWAAVSRVLRHLPAGTATARVAASHADHSPLMEPLVAPMLEYTEALLAASPPKPPSCLMISSVTGKAVTADELTSPAYWARHAVSPVKFVEAFASLVEESCLRAASPPNAFEASWRAECIDMGRGMISGFGRECLDGLRQEGALQQEALQQQDAQQQRPQQPSAQVRFVETVPASASSTTYPAEMNPEALGLSAAVDHVIESLMSHVRATRLHQFLVDPYACTPSALDFASLVDIGDLLDDVEPPSEAGVGDLLQT